MRRWPDGNSYVEAVQNSANIGDGDVQRGSYELRQNGLPKPYSGGFTTTFHFTTQSGAFAVRCFTRGNDDLERRYQAITDFLRFVQHPAFCQAEYLPHGVLVNAAWWPIIKMQWVMGRQLNAEVEKNLHNAPGLQRLAESFRRLVGALGVLGVAHGDLQHGNIIVENGELRLIDYDGIYLPALAGMLPSEYGHQNYQHPLRKEAPFDGRLDRFSSIVIYTALIALTHDAGLWQRFNNDENLLFRADDFTSHGTSDLFKALLSNPKMASLAQQLIIACDASIATVPTVEQVIAAAGGLGSQPVYSAFTGQKPSGTTSNFQQQVPPTFAAPPGPQATPSSTRSVPPQPFVMQTVRVQPQRNVATASGNPTGVSAVHRVAPAFCGNCGAPTSPPPSFCGQCGYASGSTKPPGTRFAGQWNWGAFALYPLWLMTHRRVTLGVLCLVPYFIPGVSLVTALYFGRNGSRIAVLCGRFQDEREFVAVQNIWRNWAFGVLIVATLLGVFSAMGNATSTTSASGRTTSAGPPRVTDAAPRPANVVAATGTCESPNSADKQQMEDAITQFHINVAQHRWADAERYEDNTTYVTDDVMEGGYTKTIESSPTITAVDGCHVSVMLKFQNNDSPQYCIDQVYEMAYVRGRQPSWIIHGARSASEKRLCA